MKATTKGQARLTPMQAKTASNESPRYVLCVVDLRGLREEELDSEWTAQRVEPLARLVPDVGDKVEETYALVETAATAQVAIRNEGALRYEVPLRSGNRGNQSLNGLRAYPNDRFESESDWKLCGP